MIAAMIPSPSRFNNLIPFYLGNWNTKLTEESASEEQDDDVTLILRKSSENICFSD